MNQSNPSPKGNFDISFHFFCCSAEATSSCRPRKNLGHLILLKGPLSLSLIHNTKPGPITRPFFSKIYPLATATISDEEREKKKESKQQDNIEKEKTFTFTLLRLHRVLQSNQLVVFSWHSLRPPCSEENGEIWKRKGLNSVILTVILRLRNYIYCLYSLLYVLYRCRPF